MTLMVSAMIVGTPLVVHFRYVSCFGDHIVLRGARVACLLTRPASLVTPAAESGCVVTTKLEARSI